MTGDATVLVHYVSAVLDERNGEPFEWTNGMSELLAEEHVAKVNTGRMKDPDGKSWPAVRAEIVRRGPFFCLKTLIARCLLRARRVLARRAVVSLWTSLRW